jgi:hypothetical protein
MRNVLPVIIMLVLVLAPSTHAQEKKRGSQLDRAALRRCMLFNDDIARHRKAYNVHVREVNRVETQMAHIRAQLFQMKRAIDAGDRRRGVAYTHKINEHETLRDQNFDRKLRMAEISKKESVVQEEFNRECAGRPFPKSDYLDIKNRQR